MANTPDAWSFQHFLDRVTHILTQVKTYEINYVASARPRNRFVSDLWANLGVKPDNIIESGTDSVAAQLIWSCRTPLIHPWPTREFLRHLRASPSQGVPIENRKVVMYMGRSDGHAGNGGRKVLNEDELLADIKKLLNVRAMSEELQVFKPSNFNDTASLINYFHNHVQAVIGPHGGALLNHLWTGSDTLVLEMQPSNFRGMGIFEGAKVLDQQYAILMLDGNGTSTDMYADIPAVREILSKHLGNRVGDARMKVGYASWDPDVLALN